MCKILKSSFRYLVPFTYEIEDGGYDKFSRVLQKDGKWTERPFWEKESNKSSERDVYPYIYALFTGDERKRNLGSSFVRQKDGQGNVLKLFYTEKNDFEKLKPINVTDMGIVLFRNAVGFLWYEIKTALESEEFILFNSVFKELSRSERKGTGGIYMQAEGLGRKAEFPADYTFFRLGGYIADQLSVGPGIKFFAEREVDGRVCPDKALTFHYAMLETGDDNELAENAYYFTKAYSRRYSMERGGTLEFYRPFENVCAYICSEGAGYYVMGVNGGDFFQNNFPGKFTSDYFALYLLMLYQSYSLCHYSGLLGKLSGDVGDYGDDAFYEDIRKRNREINVFLMKSVFESVSHISHQNGFFQYGLRQLRIEGNIRSLTSGLGGLEQIEAEYARRAEERAREKSEKRMNRVTIIITVFSVFSIIADLPGAIATLRGLWDRISGLW